MKGNGRTAGAVRTVRKVRIWGLLGLILGVCVTAQAQTTTVEAPSCLPVEQNGVVKGAAATNATGQTVRLYFRWFEDEREAREAKDRPFYWVPMEVESPGRFWAIPPKPEKRNKEVEYYSAVVNPAGNIVAHSDHLKVKVTSDCKLELNAQQLGVAQSLTIGETVSEQQGKRVLGFLCDGIVTRINAANVRRIDDQCHSCAIVWWKSPAVLVPASLLGVAGVVGIVIHHDHHPQPEPSPSQP